MIQDEQEPYLVKPVRPPAYPPGLETGVAGAAVVQAPGATCSVTFPLYCRRVPAVESTPAPAGVQTQLNTRARLTHTLSATVVTSNLSVQIRINASAGSDGVADSNGDGLTDNSVYRGGAWYMENQTVVYHGLPGDYNGDGDLERAVYREGAWFREGLSTDYWGLNGDIQVPGDYNRDNFADMAVFRDGTWYAAGFTTVSYGLPGDIPLPLPQAVYREFFR